MQQLTSTNSVIDLGKGNGSVSAELDKDGTTIVVTFKNAKISGDGKTSSNGGLVYFGTPDLSAKPDNIKLVLSGKNEIFASSLKTDSSVDALVTDNCNLEISGDGSLELTLTGNFAFGQSAFKFWRGILTVNGGTISASGGGKGLYLYKANAIVNDGKITVSGASAGAILLEGNLTVNNGTVSATGRTQGINVGTGEITVNGGKLSGIAEGSYYVCGISADNIILDGGTIEGIAEVNGDETYGIQGSLLMKSGKLVAEVPASEGTDAPHSAISPDPDLTALTDYRWSVKKGLMQKGPIPEDTVIGDYFAVTTLAEGGKPVPYSPVHQITSAIETSEEENPDTGALEGTTVACCALVALSAVALIALKKNKK